MVDVEDADEMLGVLERTQKRLHQLKQERDRLLKANQKLIMLVEQIEQEIDNMPASGRKEEFEEFAPEEYQYSYQGGWRPKEIVQKEGLDLGPELAHEDIAEQLAEVRHVVDKIRNYKSEDAGE